MQTTRPSLLLLSIALVAAPAPAASHPDIAGTWAVDSAKSDFGPMPAASDLVFRIAVQGEEFTVNQTGAGQPEITLRFNASGREVTNELPGAKMTSVHRWQGEALVGDIKVVGDDGSTVSFKDRIDYSADGKVMTLDRQISSPGGESHMKLVMNRK